MTGGGISEGATCLQGCNPWSQLPAALSAAILSVLALSVVTAATNVAWVCADQLLPAWHLMHMRQTFDCCTPCSSTSWILCCADIQAMRSLGMWVSAAYHERGQSVVLCATLHVLGLYILSCCSSHPVHAVLFILAASLLVVETLTSITSFLGAHTISTVWQAVHMIAFMPRPCFMLALLSTSPVCTRPGSAVVSVHCSFEGSYVVCGMVHIPVKR